MTTTDKTVLGGVGALAIGSAAATGAAGSFIVGAAAGIAAYVTHDLIVGGVYEDAVSSLRQETNKHPNCPELAADLRKMEIERGVSKAASVAVGVGTFLCPPVGLAVTGALIIGALTRVKLRRA